MTRQAKNTSLKTKISRAVKKTALLSILLCYILSTMIHAEYKQEFNDKVASFRLWGQTTVDGVKSWREISITETETGVYETAYQLYGQYRQRAVFAFPQQIVVDNIYLEYTFALDEKIYGSGNIIFSEYDEQIAYTVQDYGPNAQTAWFPAGSISYEKSVKGNEITYTFKYNGEAKVMRSVRAFTAITTVSTNYTIKDVKLVVNDKQMQVLSELEDVNQSLEDYASQMTVPIPDVNDVVDIIDGNIPSIDTSYKDAILLFTSHYIIIEILVVVIALALLSYIVYGRKT